MMDGLEAKFELLLDILRNRPDGGPDATERGLLMVYPPENELRFRALLQDYLLQMKSQELPHRVLNLDTVPFECLDEEGVLDQSYELELQAPADLKRYIADQLQEDLLATVKAAAEEMGEGAVILRSSTALFPWVSYADLLSSLPSAFACYVVIPFPGSESEGKLHFLDQRTGFNYLARRL